MAVEHLLARRQPRREGDYLRAAPGVLALYAFLMFHREVPDTRLREARAYYKDLADSSLAATLETDAEDEEVDSPFWRDYLGFVPKKYTDPLWWSPQQRALLKASRGGDVNLLRPFIRSGLFFRSYHSFRSAGTRVRREPRCSRRRTTVSHNSATSSNRSRRCPRCSFLGPRPRRGACGVLRREWTSTQAMLQLTRSRVRRPSSEAAKEEGLPPRRRG